MKIALAQLNYHIGNFDQNFEKIKDGVSQAKSQGADLVVFGELAICGYPPRDFLEFEDFIALCEQSVERVKALSTEIAIIVGCPTRNPNIEGKDLFNSALFIHEGEVQKVIHKTLLPNYDVFDEYRYFEPNSNFECIEFQEKKIALTICEDIWNVGNENPLYTTCPMDNLIEHKPDVIINISASPFDYTQQHNRHQVVKANTDRYQVPLIYVNQVGAQTELIFDGGSMVVSRDSKIVEELPHFEEVVKTFSLSDIDKGVLFENHAELPKIELIHDALIMGLKDYFQKLGFFKAIIGLSGGIDSAVTLALAVKALGPLNIKALLMPSQFSSSHSVEDSIALCERLETSYEIIPIEKNYDSIMTSLKPFFTDLPFNVAEENIQARLRAILLMAFSNKFGYILLNTTNKSEAAVGYGTLYGDLAGGLSVLGDVYKSQVFELARFINKDNEIIPENILTKPPSAELRPDQKDTDSLPEYELLDQILYQYIEERKSPGEIVDLGFREQEVERILRLVNSSEWKRYQTAPMLRVSPKAFGTGRRVPIVGKYLS